MLPGGKRVVGLVQAGGGQPAFEVLDYNTFYH
jgi:hypothetical protein